MSMETNSLSQEEAMLSPDRAVDLSALSTAATDYDIVRRAIAHIRGHWRAQPEVEEVAEAAGVTVSELHHLFRRWADLTPKAFLQALTPDHARRQLRGWAVRSGAAARPLRHPRGDVAGRMEIRRRRLDAPLRLSSLAVRHRAGHGERAGPRGSCLRGRRRGASRLCRHERPLAEGDLCRGQRAHRAAGAAHLRCETVAARP